MVTLLFKAQTGESLEITPSDRKKFSYRELQAMLEGNIRIMFSNLFIGNVIVMNEHVFDGKDLTLNEEMTGCFSTPMYGNIIICETKYMPIKSWTSFFSPTDNVIYHDFGNGFRVSFNFTTLERKLLKYGECIDTTTCNASYFVEKHCQYLFARAMESEQIDSLKGE